MLFSLHADRWDEVIERKIKYDQKVVEHTCQLLDAQGQKMVLFHKIEETFSMSAGDDTLTHSKRELYDRLLLEGSSLQYVFLER